MTFRVRGPLLTGGAALLLVLSGCADADAPPPASSSGDAAPSNTGVEAEQEAASTSDAASTAAAGDDDGEPSVTQVGAELVVDGLTTPREIVEVADGRLLLSDQAGVVHVVEDGQLRTEPFLDLRETVEGPDGGSLELGLAGFATAPDFADSGTIYTVTTVDPSDVDGELPPLTRQVNVLTRWQANPETLVVDPDSAQEVLLLPAELNDHVGGEIAFDDQGLLYTSVGADSGSESAQDPTSFAGTVVRIDPEGGEGERAYGIPEDNPFADGGEGLPEVYSYGYRNPWRLSWDEANGLLVGEAMFRDKSQQIGQPEPGDNAGYPEVDGSCWEDEELTEVCQETEAGEPIAPPVLEYSSQVGQILSGVGLVAEDSGTPWAGQVLVADWKGSLVAAEPGDAPWSAEILALPEELVSDSYVWDLDVTEGGDVYLMLTHQQMEEGEGAVYRLTQ